MSYTGCVCVAYCTLEMHLGQIQQNKEEILKALPHLKLHGAQAVVLPELCLTGATLGDLFLQRRVMDECMNALVDIAREVGDESNETRTPAPLVLPPDVTVAEAERILIMETLRQTGQNKAAAARKLGMDVKTIRNKLKQYGLSTSGEGAD